MTSQKTVTINFGKQGKVNRIWLFSRNADNGIEIHDRYELFNGTTNGDPAVKNSHLQFCAIRKHP